VKRILVIEDGTEYEEFARLFLAETFALEAAHSFDEAKTAIDRGPFDGFLVDLRFDRARDDTLEGDVDDTAARLFAGDRSEAIRYLKDNQGVMILAALRQAGHDQRAVFVHDFPRQRLENLRNLYGDVCGVPSFDAAAIRQLFEG
jgi:ActR/RegA family two-component response regulator